MIQKRIRDLVAYGLSTGLVEPEDKIYTTNRLLELFGLDELEDGEGAVAKVDQTDADTQEGCTPEQLEEILSDMLDYAYANGLMEADSVV